MSKYRRLRERILERPWAVSCEFVVPDAADDEQLSLAHAANYVAKVVEGTLSDLEVRRIGFPWSPELVERSRRSTGATIAATRRAFAEGVAVNLAGGTHHASSDAGQGYCVFNDAAVATRVAQREFNIQRVLIVDCDVHQGNGTAAIFASDPHVTTLSIHAESNFPFRKCAADFDVSLPDKTADREYLAELDKVLLDAMRNANPELVIYTSGADPFEGDRLGRLSVSKNGLQSRDRMVFSRCHDRSVPVAVTMAGGYANNVEDIVDIHESTVAQALELYQRRAANA